MSARNVNPADWFFGPLGVKPETCAKNPPETFPALPAEAYAQRDSYHHPCQCPEHVCTVAVSCSEIEPCAEPHRCGQCDDGSYVCAQWRDE